VPLNDVVNQVVNAEDGTAVDSVMIDGRMILDRRRFTTVDVRGLRAKAECAVERMRSVNAEALALGSRHYHVDRFVDDTVRSRT